MRITDRAADEAARLFSITPIEARAVLGAWVDQVSTTQAGKRQDSGIVEYRGPKPWRLMMLVEPLDHAVVSVRPSTSTRLLLNADPRTLRASVDELRKQAANAKAGRQVAPSQQPLDPERRPNVTAQGVPPTPPRLASAPRGETLDLTKDLSPQQLAWLRHVARKRGITVAEWVRTLVADAMEEDLP